MYKEANTKTVSSQALIHNIIYKILKIQISFTVIHNNPTTILLAVNST